MLNQQLLVDWTVGKERTLDGYLVPIPEQIDNLAGKTVYISWPNGPENSPENPGNLPERTVPTLKLDDGSQYLLTKHTVRSGCCKGRAQKYRNCSGLEVTFSKWNF